MENSKIEWTDHTANLWWGCTKVHAGCDNCYAEYFSDVRYGNKLWGNDNPRKIVISVWKNLLKFQADANREGKIRKVFVGSMMDIFEKPMPVIDNKGNELALINHPLVGFIGDTVSDDKTLTTAHLRDKLFALIDGGYFENLLFQFLTKRPSNINKYIPEEWKTNPPHNVMFGTSVVDNDTADTLIPQLLQVKGKRFLSIEPQLAKVDLDTVWIPCPMCNGDQSLPVEENGEVTGGRACPKCLEPYQGVISGIDWIICGGESGHNRRPYNLEWARSLRDECKRGKIPFFFKQVDKVIPIPEDLLIREFSTNQL